MRECGRFFTVGNSHSFSGTGEERIPDKRINKKDRWSKSGAGSIILRDKRGECILPYPMVDRYMKTGMNYFDTAPAGEG